MTTRHWWQTVAAVMTGLLAVLIIRDIFARISAVLLLFGLGLLVAWVMDPVLDALERRRWSRAAAVWAVTFGFLIVIALVGVLVVPGIVYQVQDAATHWQDYSTTAQTTYHRWREQIEAYAARKYPNLELMPFLDMKVDQGTQWLSQHIPVLLQWVSGQLIASMGVVAAGGMLLIVSFHFMLVIDPLRRSVREMLPPAADDEVGRLSARISVMLGQYLRGIVMISLLVGLSSTFALYIVSFFFGTKYALIIGVVTGLTYMIPYLGPLISAISAGFFGYVTASSSPWLAAGISIGAMYGVNQVFDVVVTPRVMGQRVGLHPLVILFAVFAGLSLFGIPGMIVATPAAASLKIILARWLPIREDELAAPGPGRRLTIDVAASARLLGRGLSRLGRDLERVIVPGSPATAEPPAPPSGESPESDE